VPISRKQGHMLIYKLLLCGRKTGTCVMVGVNSRFHTLSVNEHYRLLTTADLSSREGRCAAKQKTKVSLPIVCNELKIGNLN
jgi:hypothetical protein